MKINNVDEQVHVLKGHSDVWSVIREIAYSGNQEDAFYVCDIGDIVRKHKIWKSSLPRVKPYYAVKCNDNITVLEVLAALGTGFDCASKAEINKVLSLGVGTDRIIFANPAKPSSHIRHAAAVGIEMMTFDNEVELYKVKDLYPTAKMVIRIRCDAKIAQCQLGMKFGCDPITEAPKLLRLARTLGIEVIGVSFHVGSGCGEPNVFRRAISAARDIFDYASTLGFDFNLLDIGGGYPGGHSTSIDEMAKIINSALDDFFPDPTVRVIAEPGRFYVCSAYTLACSIHSIRTVPATSATGQPTSHHMYYINDGIYGSFNIILYDHQHVVAQPLKQYPGSKLYSSSIWGPTCDGLDNVIDDIPLPRMELGDWIIFEDMGAYTVPAACMFNGFPIPKVHVVADENIWLLLKDNLPLTEDHFTNSNICEKIRLLNGNDDKWSLPALPIKIKVPRYEDSPLLKEYVLDYAGVCPSG